MNNNTKVTTSSGRKVTIRIRQVGQSFHSRAIEMAEALCERL